MSQIALLSPPIFNGIISATPSGSIYKTMPGQTVLADSRDETFLLGLGFTAAPAGAGGSQISAVNSGQLQITADGTLQFVSGPTLIGQPGTGAVSILSNSTITPPTLAGDALLKIMNGNSASSMSMFGFSTGNAPSINLAFAGGTAAAPTPVSTNNALFQVAGWGYDGTIWISAGSFSIRGNGTWTATSHPTFADVRVVAPGTTTVAVGLRTIGATGGGRTLINTTTDDGLSALQVSGAAKPTFTAEGTSNNLTATGSNQATALALVNGLNILGTVAPNTGVKLPAIGTSVPIGTGVNIFNDGLNTGTIYSAGSETIDNIAGSTGVTISAGVRGRAFATSSSTWETAQLGAKIS